MLALHQTSTGIPWIRDVANTVFLKSIATVMGPTPPGTGVINDVFSFTLSKSTSPTSLPFTLFVATSITTAPSLTILASTTNLSLMPTAVTSISAEGYIFNRNAEGP